MNFIYRWRLLSKIVSAVAEKYGAESADAIGRFKGLNGKAWADFAKELESQKLGEDFDIAIGLLWFSVNAPTTDRLGFQLKRACYFTYCHVINQLFFSDGKNWRESAVKKKNFDSVVKLLALPVDFEPSDEDLDVHQ